jgi:hypothetical protein
MSQGHANKAGFAAIKSHISVEIKGTWIMKNDQSNYNRACAEEHGDKARYFRRRAGELRADAEDTANEKVRELLMERAQDCEEMAAGREAIAMTINERISG